LRSAEFGFFGVRVITCTQTPRRCGQLANAGDFDFTDTFRRPLRISWLIVGIFQILTVKRRRGRYSGDKKPASGRATNSTHAPDAVSREYRGKIAGSKEYFDV
jgi:hypothetical protein